MTNGTSLFFSAHHDCRHKFKNWNIRHDIFDHVVCCHIPPRWLNLSTIKPIKEGNFLSLIRDGGRSENLGWRVVISAPALLPPYSDLPIFGERASAIPAFVHAYLSTDFLFSEFLLINVKLVLKLQFLLSYLSQMLTSWQNLRQLLTWITYCNVKQLLDALQYLSFQVLCLLCCW